MCFRNALIAFGKELYISAKYFCLSVDCILEFCTAWENMSFQGILSWASHACLYPGIEEKPSFSTVALWIKYGLEKKKRNSSLSKSIIFPVEKRFGAGHINISIT